MSRRPETTLPRRSAGGQEKSRLAMAERQAQWAHVYVVAISNLELEDPEIERSVGELRIKLAAVEHRLRSLQEK